jgi:hemolysin activation/secretion protein/AraC-like DNA-binding protein
MHDSFNQVSDWSKAVSRMAMQIHMSLCLPPGSKKLYRRFYFSLPFGTSRKVPGFPTLPDQLSRNRHQPETRLTHGSFILVRLMAIERHLTLQELTLRPSGEWTPQARGWLVARVAEGSGYWLHGGAVRELNAGDGFVLGGNARVLLRASQLGLFKLQYFSVQPQYLNGLLSVAECRRLEAAAASPSPPVSFFSVGEPVAQKFSRIVELPHDHELSLRCALLQLWSAALHGLLAATPAESVGGNKLHERLLEVVGKMTEAELADASLADLAAQLHCSERHFSRLFREEFGVPLRTRQIELRLQRARQLLADSNAKVINVAYDSGYRHLGLFNAMFKKRFGVTPSEWRQQNGPKNSAVPARNNLSRVASGINLLLAVSAFFFSLNVFAQTASPATDDSPAVAIARAALYQKMAEAEAADKQAEVEAENVRLRQQTEEEFGPVHHIPVSTNAGPHFKVEKYLVTGNTILAPGIIGGILTNVPDAFGTNVTFDGIQAALGDLQMAYRERGFVTVSVGLPPQKLTNAEVRVHITEARLAAINVTGNRWFSTANVLRALPSLQTNMLLNSHVFQRELDLANASRDRQIYPVIGPGPEPGTSALTLKVKDTFPFHARTEVNNDSTPGTPDLRVNSSAQYDNLWNLNHQIGVQYSFSPEQMKQNDYFSTTPFDDPLVANYSGYYRIPLANPYSVEQQVESNPSSFGYNEVTHKFNLPPAVGQPDVTFYASRSTEETGVKYGPSSVVTDIPNQILILSQDSGDNLTMNQGLGGKLSVPLRQFAGIRSTLSVGLDYKDYNEASFNTNNYTVIQYYNDIHNVPTNSTAYVHAPQPTRYTDLQYLPVNFGLNASIPDKLGTTFFNATVNLNPFGIYANNAAFAAASYSTNAHANYVTLQSGMTRDQSIYKEWTVRLHADGQWADTPLFSNEQYGMGGPSGVRGYPSGVAYGDSGWRMTVEPRTPQMSIGMAGNEGDEVPVWVRGSVFVDYGQLYRLDPTPGYSTTSASLLGVGWGVTANIGSHFDAWVSMAWPLMSSAEIPGGSAYVYFAVGAQF